MNIDLAIFFVKHDFVKIAFEYDLITDTWLGKTATQYGSFSISATGRTPYDCLKELKQTILDMKHIEEAI